MKRMFARLRAWLTRDQSCDFCGEFKLPKADMCFDCNSRMENAAYEWAQNPPTR